MLTVVALPVPASDLSQVPVVASALARLAHRQELAVVYERGPADPDRPGGTELSPARLATALRAALRTALPDQRLVAVAPGPTDDPLADIELVGALLEEGVMPLVFAPPGETDAVAATLADKLSATALLRMVDPGLAGTGTGARLRARRGRPAPVVRAGAPAATADSRRR
jgi:hypothetical protein